VAQIDRMQRVMISNGLLVILVAMLAGFMLIFKLIGGFELWPGHILSFDVYGSSAAWVRAHSGGIANGLLVLVVALGLPKLGLSDRLLKWVGYGFIYIAWSFTWFYWLGGAAGNRALTVGDSPLGKTDVFGGPGCLAGLAQCLSGALPAGRGRKGCIEAGERVSRGAPPWRVA
jgi:hypothetical protein